MSCPLGRETRNLVTNVWLRNRVFDFVKEMHIKMFDWDAALYLEHVGPSMAGRMGTALREPHAAE